jgi:CubicO group peptidase (beta-lactamase class C family)
MVKVLDMTSAPLPRATPAACGFEPGRLAEAVRFAETHETTWDRDLAKHLASGHFEPPPWNEIIGPTRPRGGPAGMILRHGGVVAEWGDIHRPDMTFSIAKSYLAIVAGLAVDRGLIADIDHPVRELVDDGGFDPPHNHRITWRHLLEQTSEWEGTLWDKPDLVDRNRDLKSEGGNPKKGTHRPLQEPGAYWEYNDVRVNRLSLALLRVWRRPLPDVLKEYVMDPMGCSSEWEWRGYRNSTVDIDGRLVESVSGGGHWGGGMFIGSEDHARVGLLMLNGGRWGPRQVLSKRWIECVRTPSRMNPAYGLMWWLNTGRASYPSASASSILALGAGSNVIWIDPESDLVAVIRWIAKDAVDGFMQRVLAALTV